MKLKNLITGLVFAATSMSIVAEAIARPAGGGRSIGRQSQNVARQAPPPAPAAAPNARQNATPATPATPAAAAAAKPRSPWKNILGGALLGLGLGALLSHFGLGGAFASMIASVLMIALLAGAAFFIYRLIKGKGKPGATPATQGVGGYTPTPEIGARLPAQAQAYEPLQPVQSSASDVSLDKPAPAFQPWGVPAGFDTDAFIRQAKTHFLRLQAAWDKADFNDIREFTTPEMYAELKMQIDERDGRADFTDVVHINAELQGMETGERDYLASVQFSGTIRSAPGAQPEPFREVWNMSKPLTGNGNWVLAGIQQLA